MSNTVSRKMIVTSWTLWSLSLKFDGISGFIELSLGSIAWNQLQMFEINCSAILSCNAIISDCTDWYCCVGALGWRAFNRSWREEGGPDTLLSINVFVLSSWFQLIPKRHSNSNYRFCQIALRHYRHDKYGKTKILYTNIWRFYSQALPHRSSNWAGYSKSSNR